MLCSYNMRKLWRYIISEFFIFCIFLPVIIKGRDVRLYTVHLDHDDFYIISTYHTCIYLKKLSCPYRLFFIKKNQCQIHDLEFERDLQNITCPSKSKDIVVCLERLNIWSVAVNITLVNRSPGFSYLWEVVWKVQRNFILFNFFSLKWIKKWCRQFYFKSVANNVEWTV